MGFYWLLRIEKWKYAKSTQIKLGNPGAESLFYGSAIAEDLTSHTWHSSSLQRHPKQTGCGFYGQSCMEFGQNELKLVSDFNSSLYFQVNQSRVYRPSLVEKPVKSSQFRREPITLYMGKSAINREAAIEVPSKCHRRFFLFWKVVISLLFWDTLQLQTNLHMSHTLGNGT